MATPGETPPAADAAARGPAARAGGLLLLIGLIAFAAAAVSGVGRAVWLAQARHAEGLVTDVQEEESTSRGSRTRMYRPVVTFTAEDGRVVSVNGAMWSSYSPWRIGDRAAVDYAPGRPGGAVIAEAGQRWFLTGVFALFGVLLCGMGWAFRRLTRDPTAMWVTTTMIGTTSGSTPTRGRERR